MGENVYRFLFRSVVGSFVSAVGIEWERLGNHHQKKNALNVKAQKSSQSLAALRCKHILLFISPFHNHVLQGSLLSVAMAYFFSTAFGPSALKLFIGQGIVAFTLLEFINFVEHYGLERKKMGNKDNEYEAVTPAHSWNAGHRITNYLLFKLQRHSDHHAYAGRRYQILRTW